VPLTPGGGGTNPGGIVVVAGGDDDMLYRNADFLLEPLAELVGVSKFNQISGHDGSAVEPVVHHQRAHVDAIVNTFEGASPEIGQPGQVPGCDIHLGCAGKQQSAIRAGHKPFLPHSPGNRKGYLSWYGVDKSGHHSLGTGILIRIILPCSSLIFVHASQVGSSRRE